MLRLLLVFATISIVCCNENCPAYSAFDSFSNSGDLKSKLNGEFAVVYTSAPVINCIKAEFAVDANNITIGQFKLPFCCVRIDNFVQTSSELEYDVSATPGYVSGCPEYAAQHGSKKLLAEIGAGNSLCLIVAVCQPDYYGINVFCRGNAPLLLNIIILLSNLLGSLGFSQALALQPVVQTNCVFPSNNCPVL